MLGDQDDIFFRLKRTLPASWFGRDGEQPVVDAILSGAAWAFAQLFAFYAYAKRQTRIATQTGGWLELTANDFFTSLRRFSGEQDPAYSRRIRLEVFRDRNTRHAIDRTVFDLTGQHPRIYEAWRPGDCGGYGVGALAYGRAGYYGSRTAPFEVFIHFDPLTNYGIPNRGGYGDLVGGYGFGNFSYVDAVSFQGSGPTFADVMAALDRVRTASITYYVQLNQLGDPNP